MTTSALHKEKKVPPIAFQDYPVDIHLRIRRVGARYEADIMAVGHMERISIGMSPEDLKELNGELQMEIQEVAGEAAALPKPTTEQVERDLRSLAEVGSHAYRQVFGHHDAGGIIQNAIAAVEQTLGGQRAVSIQIASEDFFLPWDILYPASMAEPLAHENFWGMNHIVSRVIVQDTRPGAFVSPVIPIDSRPRLGLLTYDGLPAVRTKEIPFFKKLAGDGVINLFTLRHLDPALNKKQTEFEAFKCFWNNAFNVAHFACHAFYVDKTPTRSHLLLSDDFAITLRDMSLYLVDADNQPLVLDNNPVVIMNACQSGNLNPLYTSHFAGAFLKHGARGVVATECEVPDDFAADFVAQLYAHLLAGETLGQSLLAARQYFLKQSNPAGLLYSMYAPPSIRLVKTGVL